MTTIAEAADKVMQSIQQMWVEAFKQHDADYTDIARELSEIAFAKIDADPSNRDKLEALKMIVKLRGEEPSEKIDSTVTISYGDSPDILDIINKAKKKANGKNKRKGS